MKLAVSICVYYTSMCILYIIIKIKSVRLYVFRMVNPIFYRHCCIAKKKSSRFVELALIVKYIIQA